MISDLFGMRRSPALTRRLAGGLLSIGPAIEDRPADKQSGRCGGRRIIHSRFLTVAALAGLLAVPGLTGCTAPSTGNAALTNQFAMQPSQSSDPVQFQSGDDRLDAATPVVNVPPNNIVVARSADADRPAGDAAPETPPSDIQAAAPPRPRRDPGADQVMADLMAGIDGPDQVFPTAIRMVNLRNMSRSTAREFEQFQDRLVGLLDRSGQRHGISVSRDPNAHAQFELSGAAYLIMRQGFDQWELYLRINRVGESWSVWQPHKPVRVLRQPMVNSPQILVGEPR